jgi:uncharacterized repeat protein (TIGR01451 family)
MLARTLALVRRTLGQVDSDRRPSQPRRSRKLGVEPLEARRLLAATDLAAISGVVFFDPLADGFQPGEGLPGASVLLFEDDGDGNFEPRAGDAQVGSDVTGSGGHYRFERLEAGTYFVQQPSQVVAGEPLKAKVSAPLVITAADAAGVDGMTIDTFDQTRQSVTAFSSGGNNPDFNALPTADAIGGERDLYAWLTDGVGAVSMGTLVYDMPVLQFDSRAGVTGVRVVSWDGTDGDGSQLDATGLGGEDLTEDGNNAGLQLVIGADQDGGSVEIRVYTDAGHWSRATVAIPNTGGLAEDAVLVDFEEFQDAGFAGGADLENVGAVELEIITPALSVDGRLDSFGTYGHTVQTYNFANTRIIDLRLDKVVDNSSPNLKDNVTFTITVTNDGPDGATGVAVADTLPAGLSFVGSNPSQGNYDRVGGTWTIGALGVGQSVTLQLTAKVDTVGTKINTAQVSAADQYDPDSTPANDDPSEDDQDSARLTLQLVDLSLTKKVDEARPEIGDVVTFTIAVHNAGPNTATNVAVGDTLPAGLSYESDDPSQGSYSAGSGEWTVGTLGVGGSATLQISAQVNAGGTHVNTAQVTAADQYDPDSTPNNNVPSEDDQDSAKVTPWSALGGIVYVDENDDAVRDPGELGIPGVKLRLAGNDEEGNAVRRSATTGADGRYLFTKLPPSDATGYRVVELQPADYVDGKEAVGNLGGQIVNPSSRDRMRQIVVVSGAQGKRYNFGEIRPASISGYVYHDRNKDGKKQGVEKGIQGVELLLTGVDDLGNTVKRTTTTDSDGFYNFDMLRPSDGAGYRIVETQPKNYQDGEESPGTYTGLQSFSLVPRPVPQVLDDAFASLVLDSGTEGINFNFGEVLNVLSKRRFLASW